MNYDLNSDVSSLLAMQREVVDKKILHLHYSYYLKYGSLSIPISINSLIKLINSVITITYSNDYIAKLFSRDEGKWVISLPGHFHKTRKRIEAAHEIVHILLHENEESLRLSQIDSNLFENEVIEYGARKLLIPSSSLPKQSLFKNAKSISRMIVNLKMKFEVTSHALIRRIFEDNDTIRKDLNISEIIIWDVVKSVDSKKISVVPSWKFTKFDPNSFIPLKKCHAKNDSVVFRAVYGDNLVAIEDVNIGSLKGKFLVDAHGYWRDETGNNRRIISIFRNNWE